MTRAESIALGTTRSTSEVISETSPQVKSAVHVEHMSGDVTCHWRRQEQRRIYNLVSFAEAAERNLFNEVLCHFLRHAFAHSHIDKSWRNGVHGYVLPRKLA